MRKPEPRFLRAFTVHYRPEAFAHLYANREEYKGHLEPCDRQARPAWLAATLNGYEIAGTRYVGEKYLEEWIARRPDALFGNTPVLLLGSENYRPRLGWLDLLFVDGEGEFHIVELKIEPVAENAGTLPGDIANQICEYVDMLRLRSLSGLDSHYAGFAESFHRKTCALRADFEHRFGPVFRPRDPAEAAIHEVYLAAEFDERSYKDLTEHGRDMRRPVRLVFFRFYRPQRTTTHPYLEFWEYPLAS